MVQHPNVPWIHCATPSPGAFQCVCRGCGAQMGGPAGAQASDAFARAHAQHAPALIAQPPKPMGLGDLVAKVTGAFGVKPCAPCKKRQQALNNAVPKIWPR